MTVEPDSLLVGEMTSRFATIENLLRLKARVSTIPERDAKEKGLAKSANPFIVNPIF